MQFRRNCLWTQTCRLRVCVRRQPQSHRIGSARLGLNLLPRPVFVCLWVFVFGVRSVLVWLEDCVRINVRSRIEWVSFAFIRIRVCALMLPDGGCANFFRAYRPHKHAWDWNPCRLIRNGAWCQSEWISARARETVGMRVCDHLNWSCISLFLSHCLCVFVCAHKLLYLIGSYKCNTPEYTEFCRSRSGCHSIR